jgi:hypothetical protein
MRYLKAIGVVLVAMCAATANAQPADAKKLKDQLTGDAKNTAANNPQCKLFSQAEIAAYLGAAVGSGQNAAGGLGCNWSDKDHASFATVSVVPPNYFPEPSMVKGFKRLPHVGPKAWVAPDSGWSAATLAGDAAIVVVLYGKSATEAAAVALLQESVKRRTK